MTVASENPPVSASAQSGDDEFSAPVAAVINFVGWASGTTTGIGLSVNNESADTEVTVETDGGSERP